MTKDVDKRGVFVQSLALSVAATFFPRYTSTI